MSSVSVVLFARALRLGLLAASIVLLLVGLFAFIVTDSAAATEELVRWSRPAERPGGSTDLFATLAALTIALFVSIPIVSYVALFFGFRNEHRTPHLVIAGLQIALLCALAIPTVWRLVVRVVHTV